MGVLVFSQKTGRNKHASRELPEGKSNPLSRLASPIHEPCGSPKSQASRDFKVSVSNLVGGQLVQKDDVISAQDHSHPNDREQGGRSAPRCPAGRTGCGEVAEATGDPRSPPLGSPPSCGSHQSCHPTQKNNGPRPSLTCAAVREVGRHGMGYRSISRGKRAQQLVLDPGSPAGEKRLDGSRGEGISKPPILSIPTREPPNLRCPVPCS